MPLDPAARAICDAMAATFPPVDFDRSGTENRRLIQEALAARGVPDTEPVAALEGRRVPGPPGPRAYLEDREIRAPARPLPVRISRRLAAGPEPLPVAAFFHGRGWVVCDL